MHTCAWVVIGIVCTQQSFSKSWIYSYVLLSIWQQHIVTVLFLCCQPVFCTGLLSLAVYVSSLGMGAIILLAITLLHKIWQCLATRQRYLLSTRLHNYLLLTAGNNITVNRYVIMQYFCKSIMSTINYITNYFTCNALCIILLVTTIVILLQNTLLL